MQDRLKTFWLLEGIGGLSWIYMYLVWIFGYEPAMFMVIPLGMIAILFSIVSLVYAVFRLNKENYSLIAVLAGNFWVAADSFWAINDIGGSDIFLMIGKMFTLVLAIIATWEFISSKDNIEKLAIFAEFFRKFRSS